MLSEGEEARSSSARSAASSRAGSALSEVADVDNGELVGESALA
ncbi:hypothetical protein [Streptomyces sp. NPDC048386]